MPKNDNEILCLEIDKHVGSIIIKIRQEKKIAQGEIAQKIGVSIQQLQKYEKGINRVSASRLYLLSLALDIKISSFFEELSQKEFLEAMG